MMLVSHDFEKFCDMNIVGSTWQNHEMRMRVGKTEWSDAKRPSAEKNTKNCTAEPFQERHSIESTYDHTNMKDLIANTSTIIHHINQNIDSAQQLH